MCIRDRWYYEEQPWVAKRIEKLEGDIRMLERLSPYAAINYIRKAIGYDEFCTEYADYRRIKADDLFDVLDELLDAAREYKTYDAWFDHIENYTKELQEFYRVQNQNPNSVALATLHSVKGCLLYTSQTVCHPSEHPERGNNDLP